MSQTAPTTPTPSRPTIDQQTSDTLIDCARTLMQAVPEIDAIAFVVTWKFPTQPDVCRGIVTSGTGAPTMSQLMRLSHALLQVMDYMTTSIGGNLLKMDASAKQLAEKLRESSTPQEAREPEAAPPTSP